ncbi:MAG: permease [Bacillota bacterium]|nr:permease [Bacillota bacterium]MDW7678189.1 permease [Bacillota bacterium]
MKPVLKKYRGFFIALAALLIMTLIDRSLGVKAIGITVYSFKEMILILPPIFILLGLLDVWVPRETMVKYMGDNSGVRGILLAIFIGSAAAGPLYGAFPVAAVFMKKGVKFSNILIFIGAWSTTKIPMFLFEMASLGKVFAITRLLINIPGIILIAGILAKLISEEEEKIIYQNAEKYTT